MVFLNSTGSFQKRPFEPQLIQGLAVSKCSGGRHAFPSASVVGTDRMALGFKHVIADATT
jgi:hypothetical protein